MGFTLQILPSVLWASSWSGSFAVGTSKVNLNAGQQVLPWRVWSQLCDWLHCSQNCDCVSFWISTVHTFLNNCSYHGKPQLNRQLCLNQVKCLFAQGCCRSWAQPRREWPGKWFEVDPSMCLGMWFIHSGTLPCEHVLRIEGNEGVVKGNRFVNFWSVEHILCYKWPLADFTFEGHLGTFWLHCYLNIQQTKATSPCPSFCAELRQ